MKNRNCDDNQNLKSILSIMFLTTMKGSLWINIELKAMHGLQKQPNTLVCAKQPFGAGQNGQTFPSQAK